MTPEQKLAFDEKSKELKFAAHLFDLVSILPGDTIEEKTGLTGPSLNGLKACFKDAEHLCAEWCAMVNEKMTWLPPRKHKWARVTNE